MTINFNGSIESLQNVKRWLSELKAEFNQFWKQQNKRDGSILINPDRFSELVSGISESISGINESIKKLEIEADEAKESEASDKNKIDLILSDFDQIQERFDSRFGNTNTNDRTVILFVATETIKEMLHDQL